MSTLVRVFASLLILLSGVSNATSQTSVKQYLQQVAAGWTTDAKKALPDLLIESPDDPGVLFLHASLVDDVKKALPLLERIVSAHPKSDWADDAMARIVIGAAGKGEVERARKSFAQMREQFPQSELLPVVYDVMRATVGPPSPTDKAPAVVAQPVSPKPTEAAETAKSTKQYTLVTRSTYSKEEADALLGEFKKKRMRARITSDTFKNKQRYVVSVGEYESQEDAQKDVDAVRAVCKCKPVPTKR